MISQEEKARIKYYIQTNCGLLMAAIAAEATAANGGMKKKKKKKKTDPRLR